MVVVSRGDILPTMVFPGGIPRSAIPRSGISGVCFSAVEVPHESIHRGFSVEE